MYIKDILFVPFDPNAELKPIKLPKKNGQREHSKKIQKNNQNSQ